ncbi:BnaCnng41190D [Brassica napus]|uniref:BnaCnng41190D protein n=1 Tax=Brassica napus TaxID=3708 RepID=A0A078JAV6_BRANA|nr:BnaCnng41190D [Brassica napus]
MFFSTDSFHRQPQTWKSVHNSSDQVFADHDH